MKKAELLSLSGCGEQWDFASFSIHLGLASM
jgi:hypothetical protein